MSNFKDLLTLIEAEDNVVHYGVVYHISGSDDKATNILKIIDVDAPRGSKIYPEYINKQINDSPTTKQMKDQGARVKKIQGAWRGNINAEIDKAKEELASGNLMQSYAYELKNKISELEYIKRHLDGKPYVTAYGRDQ